MLVTMPASKTLGQAVDQLFGPARRGRKQPQSVVSSTTFMTLLSLLTVIETTSFSRHELKTWQRRLKRWQKHPAVLNTTRVADRLDQTQVIVTRRLRRAQ